MDQSHPRIIPDIVTVLKARGKRALAGVNCNAVPNDVSCGVRDGVTSFLRLNYATYSCKRMRHCPTIYWRDLFSVKAESWKI